MDPRRFWSLIALSGSTLTISHLQASLNALPWWDAWRFEQAVIASTTALDTPGHRYFAEQAIDSGPSDAVQPGRADFGDLCATIVALGEDVWSAVRAAPALLAATWPTDLGRSLVTVSTSAVQISIEGQIEAMAIIHDRGRRPSGLVA